MKTNDLKFFQKLVELKSYKKTAAYFNHTQPTITAAVKRLSKEFGAELVKQDSPRGPMTITQAGQVLYQRAQDFDLLLNLSKQEILRASLSKINLGISPLVKSQWTADLLADLQKNN